MNCPRCRAELGLEDLVTGGRHALVAVCTACGGHWMRASDLQRLSEIVEPVLVELLSLSPSDQAQALRCPECHAQPQMRKFKSLRDARVTVDTCDVCGGVWLDSGELKAIQQESLPALVGAFLASKRQPPTS